MSASSAAASAPLTAASTGAAAAPVTPSGGAGVSATAAAGAAAAAVQAQQAALPDKVVIYDGVCNLCNGTVKFLIARDPGKLFKFVALQSQAAQPLLAHFNISREEALASITFIDEGVAYRKSAAALQIASYLPAPYKFLSGCMCLPRFLRDPAYDLVAVNRYRIFGQSEECLMPSRDVLSRFLDAEELKGKKAKKTE